MKIKIIGQTAFAFFETEKDMDNAYYIIERKPFYMGLISKLSYTKAAKVAQVHVKYRQYYKYAMAPLFYGKGILRSGTEDPVMAIESYKTKSESDIDMPYILIWKIFK